MVYLLLKSITYTTPAASLIDLECPRSGRSSPRTPSHSKATPLVPCGAKLFVLKQIVRHSTHSGLRATLQLGVAVFAELLDQRCCLLLLRNSLVRLSGAGFAGASLSAWPTAGCSS